MRSMARMTSPVVTMGKLAQSDPTRNRTGRIRASAQTPVLDALRAQESLRASAVQQRERRVRPGLGAGRGRDGDRARRVLDWPARARVEHVTVAAAVLQQEASRVAARRE